MKFVDNIPPKFIPDESMHVDHFKVVRALKNKKCDKNSFLPTFLEPGRASSFSFNPDNPESYSLSLYKTIDDLYKATKAFKSFWKNHHGYAVGSTSLKRGISLKENMNSGHIAYFLQDAYNNNPYLDFEYVEDENDEND